jgi:hypothetical protein
MEIPFLPTRTAMARRMKAEIVILIQKSRIGTWKVKNQRTYAAGRVKTALRPSTFIERASKASRYKGWSRNARLVAIASR